MDAPRGKHSPADGVVPVIGWFGGYYKTKRFQNCDHIVWCHQRYRRAYGERGNCSRARRISFQPFPDIADLPPIDRASLSTPKDAKVLLTLSRLHPKKGLDVFLEALCQNAGLLCLARGQWPVAEGA